MKSRFLFCIIVTLLITALYALNASAAQLNSKLQDLSEAMQPGWNLGNTFDATNGETSWGNPKTTKEMINFIAESGYKSIRIPITWDQRLGEEPDYTIRPEFLERISEVIQWSLDENLAVIINLHHDTRWMLDMAADHDRILDRYKKIWLQLADYFKDYSELLIFESINEPRFSDDWNKDDPSYFSMLDELNTEFYNIVRNSGGNNKNRILLLPSLVCGTTEERLGNLKKYVGTLDDDNIMVTAHYYGFYFFSVNLSGYNKFNQEVKSHITDTFDRLHDMFVAEGIPVIIGEIGLLGFDTSLNSIERAEMLKYFEFITYYAREKKMPVFLWDNGQHMNRKELKWGDEVLNAVIQSASTGRSTMAESDSIFISQGSDIEDAQIKVYLNGNKLENIELDGNVLTQGEDYIFDEDTLTIKADTIKKLIGTDDTCRVLGTLSCNFSHGPDWQISLRYYNTPELIDTKGTSGTFAIPVEFNGDLLASLEAFYANGQIAGPADWTSYKEYGRCFEPDYKASTIRIKYDFFKEVKDGELKLNIHFMSGKTVSYNIEKQAENITGTGTKRAVIEEAPPTTPAAPEEAAAEPEIVPEPDTTANNETLEKQTEKQTENQTEVPPTKNTNNILIIILSAAAVLAAGAAGVIFTKRKK